MTFLIVRETRDPNPGDVRQLSTALSTAPLWDLDRVLFFGELLDEAPFYHVKVHYIFNGFSTLTHLIYKNVSVGG